MLRAMLVPLEKKCESDHSRCENAPKHLGLETNVAVVHRLTTRVGVVCRCEMCKKLVFCNIL